MGWIRAERGTQGNLKIGGLVVSTEAAGRLGRARRIYLCMEIIIDGGVSLQKNELVQTTFEKYTNGRFTEPIWGIGLESGEKWLQVETNEEQPCRP